LRRQRRNRRKLAVIAALVAVVIAGPLILVRLALYRPPRPQPVTPAQAEEARVAIGRAKSTLYRVSKAAAEGRRSPFEMRISEDDLTNFIASDTRFKARLASMEVSEPMVRFRKGRVSFSGLKKMSGKDTYFTVGGTPTAAQGGRLELSDVEVSMGKLNVSSVAAGKVRETMDAMFRSGETRIPADVTTIEAQDGFLVLRGVSRPE
jgi:hypothetical protein